MAKCVSPGFGCALKRIGLIQALVIGGTDIGTAYSPQDSSRFELCQQHQQFPISHPSKYYLSPNENIAEFSEKARLLEAKALLKLMTLARLISKARW